METRNVHFFAKTYKVNKIWNFYN